MRIYTRHGDAGETGLFGGPRVAKSHLRVEAYGAVDELNATLGFAGSILTDLPNLGEEIRELQAELFVVGADLATPPGAAEAAEQRITRTTDAQVSRLEARIDALDAETPPLDRFILPGGDEGAAALQIARTVCRRAERRIVALASAEEITDAVLAYVNRLSDLFFVMARWVNAQRGIEEPVWVPREE